MVGLEEANSQVVQDGRFMQVTEGGEVVLSHQDVGVTQERKRVTLLTDGIIQRLRKPSIHHQYTINISSR